MRIVRGVIENPLAALAFIAAGLGGFAVSDTWIGHLIGNIVNIGPIYLPHVLFGAAVFTIACDLFRDGIPERLAIYLALVAPSLAMAIPEDAKLHTLLGGWITDLNDWLDRALGPWFVGDAKNVTLTIVGMMSIAISILWCQRYAKNGSQQMAAPAAGTTAAATTTVAPTPVRRRAR
jgi:hypothetical protein